MKVAQRALFFLIFLAPLATWAQYPAGFVQTIVASGISNPTVMAHAPDGRIFVARQNGVLRVIKNGALLTTPFVTLTVDANGERGLIGIAFDPDFATNNYLYLYYTVPATSAPVAPPHNRVIRITANGDVAAAASQVTVLDLDPLSTATNHNGGALAFGPDGKLYVAVGENANPPNAQNLDTYHGKILRINKDGSIPAGNPYTSGSAQRQRVWAHGVRNPYTIAFHPVTGRFIVNDVGQNAWEEINDATVGGRNFGWPATEGMFNPASFPTYTNPIYAYGRGSADGLGCALTGGTYFNPPSTNYPSVYYGKYFIHDFCSNWINAIDVSVTPGVRSAFATSIAATPVNINTGPDGNLYFLSRGGTGVVYKIVYNNSSIPFIVQQPTGLSVSESSPAGFTVAAIGSLPLSYQWQFEGTNIPGATGATYAISSTTLAHSGDYKVVISNSAGSTSSAEVTLNVAANELPEATVTLPSVTDTYIAGTTIDFEGTGTDVEDGVLPASAFSWQINFHHDTHQHDQPAVVGVKNGTFNIPDEGETSSNVWYRVILTVTDSDGATATDFVDVHPRKSTLSFATSPPGLQILLDGQPFDTPGSVVSVEGLKRTLSVNADQLLNGSFYEFTSWSHGGNTTQTLVTPANDAAYTAIFQLLPNAPPFADIVTPAAAENYSAGNTINFSGVGTDPEDGTLPPSAFKWAIKFIQGDNVQLRGEVNGSREGTFNIPDTGDPSADVFYRIVLSVTDFQGTTRRDSVEIHPRKTTLTFTTDPAGLIVSLDGQAFTTPVSVVSVEGMKRNVSVAMTQAPGGGLYQFILWLHGGNASQIIVTPVDDLTFTASFQLVTGLEAVTSGEVVTFFPNPAKSGQLSVRLSAGYDQEIELTLLNPHSKEALALTTTILCGDNRLAVNTEGLSEGLYIASVRLNGESFHRKVLIIR